MSKKFTFESIGSFELTQPNMRVSDPCFNKDVWCSRVLPNCQPGTWEAAIAHIDSNFWGHRVGALVVRHTDGPAFKRFESVRFDRVPKGIEIFPDDAGVDSGQCGFFDDAFFRDDKDCEGIETTVDYGSPWYNVCCDITLSEEMGGIIPHGAVSSSGAGDGGYPIYYIEKDGQVAAAMLQFLDFND